MGGIGKTTLARNVYDNILILQHFYVRAWVTISQEYDVRGILLEALSCIKKPTTEMDKLTVNELGEQLYKSLSGRRNLIVLDDMWSTEAWDKINCFFPDNDNRSRIVFTTRLSNVAVHFGSPCFSVDFLDEDKSWDLFCEKAFAQEGCPLELYDIGKKIVKKCKGLPLSIVVIGGFLGKSCKTREYWENIAKDISPIMNSKADDQWLDILSLSYSHLPACLKPCFLYFGIFPEDYEIRVSRLINLWVAEGFLKTNKERGVEEVADGYIKDLIDRNLILVGSLRSNGKIKTCYIHDILRDLCLRVAEKEKFLFVTRVHDTLRDINGQRRIVIHGSTFQKHHHPRVFNLGSTSPARSLVCEGGLVSFGCRLLRVLLIEVYTDSMDAIFQQVNLRFLACEYCTAPIGRGNTYELPSSISRLCNLETIIITGSIYKVVAPSEIWDIPRLRHLEFNSVCLADPLSRGEKDDIVLQNLQTLMTVLNFRCSEEVCKRIPNIKKVHIMYDDFSGGEGVTSLQSVGCLNKLESLYYYFKEVPNRHDLLHSLAFPRSLKKLTLTNSELRWDDLTILGSLPYLEVLKLKYHSVRGSDWNPVEGEFLCLKFLGIYWCSDLINWDAASYNFPALEEYLTKLDEIPLGIGEIATLEGICVVNCTVSAAISAIRAFKLELSFLPWQNLRNSEKRWNWRA